MSDSIYTVFASVQPHHVLRKERQMHRSANLAAGFRMLSRDISAHNSFNKPPASRWKCNPSNHNQWTVCTLFCFCFTKGEIIAGRLAQTIVYGQLFRGRQVVNKEVDLVALLSLSSTLRGERKSLIPWKTAAVSYKGSLFTGMRGATGQGRQPALGVPKFFTLWGCCVLYESTAVALSSHTGEESTLA